jgi:replicative DNA helicase Mcm
MHEAMEQQTVTISKANVQATLSAQTSVLAAANPKLGRFEPFQVIAQQIDMPPTLLNRFDVIFTLRDLPDRGKDEAIATHVLLEHKREGRKQVIEKELLRKYIAYAKQRYQPLLTEEAIKELKKFYVDLRNAPVSTPEGVVKPIPISARQLDALIRLSEASAKMQLKKKVEKDDAKLAIEIMKYYLMQVGFDQETKTFDIDRIATGVSTSQRGKIIVVREAISRLEGRMGKLIPIEELAKELEEKMSKDEIENSIQKLKQTGDIFEPRKGYVQRV